MKQMKIAYVIPQYLPSTGGDVREIHKLGRRVAEKGNAVTVYTTDAGSEDALFSNRGVILKKGSEVIDGIEVRRYPIQGRFLSMFRFLVDKDRLLKNTPEIDQYIENIKTNGLISLRNLIMILRPPISRGLYNSLLEANNYDIYHAVGIWASNALYAYQASVKNRIPLVIKPAFHSADRFYYNPTNLKILKHAHAIIANTQAEVEIFGKFGVDTRKITVIGCGVDLEKYSKVNKAEIQKIRSDHRFDDYEMNVLFLSRLQKEKGLFDTMNAVIKLNESGQKIQLLIAGSDYGNNSRLVKKVVAKHDFIKYLGRISEESKINLLHACDALVVPSIADSFGIVYIEAWACKKPVIGADIPSTRSLISYGEDGFYVEYGDKDAIAEKVSYLAENYDNRIAMGEKGYEKVKRKYTDQEVFKKTYQIYTELCRR